jgi:hypothetical protein
MRVARVEPVGDAPAGLVEHNILRPDRPLAGEGQWPRGRCSGSSWPARRGPRSSAGPRGSELSHSVPPPSEGMCVRVTMVA